MTATVQRRGRYALFATPRQNRILVLGKDQWFAWVGGQQGDILVRSNEEHERDRTIQEGEFYLVDFEGDPDFTDVPHLFLERNGEFVEVILPNGLPTDDDAQKRVVGTEKTIDSAALKRHLSANDTERSSAPGGEGAFHDRELPIPDFDDLSVRRAKVRLDELNTDELRRLRDYESANKRRKTLIHEIERRMK
jgi:hypothetical protein